MTMVMPVVPINENTTFRDFMRVNALPEINNGGDAALTAAPAGNLITALNGMQSGGHMSSAELTSQPTPETGRAKIISITGAPCPAITRQQVADELQVSLKTVERLINRGELKAVKVYSKWRIMRADFEAFVQHLRDEQAQRIGTV